MPFFILCSTNYKRWNIYVAPFSLTQGLEHGAVRLAPVRYHLLQVSGNEEVK